jgi:uncharacterized protein YfdQ (DUF2303 family)
MIKYYEGELLEAKKEVGIKGNIQNNISQLPGYTEKYFSDLQELEAILAYLNIELRKLQQKYFKQYLETYNKALSTKEAEKYANGEEDICDFEMIINDVARIRNLYLSIIKALESKNFMLGHLVKIKTAGMENFTI